MLEYKIDDYITLRLVNKKTVIYIKGERFMQCKYLLLINPHEQEKQREIDSIDEAADELSSELENGLKPIDLGITPKQEFWGHCSNIQAWVENNYDTRLLHRSLSFFLLMKIAEKGDERAKIFFKEEIAKRLSSGNKNVISFLIEESLISYLDHEEIIQCILIPEEVEIIFELEKLLGIELIWTFWKARESTVYHIEDKHVKEINLNNLKLNKFPDILGQLIYLEKINLSNNNINSIPFSALKDLKYLKELNLSNNPISIAEKKKKKELRPDLDLI
ncbi:MAG: hypothetical protein EU529_14810 [Promethearchaeota archaeon]|nr:MAG: hypothetical protein EU529_14810 [Candidatus Lokiarchaeota archaeon]